MRPLIKDLNALYFTLHHGIRTYYLHRLKHQSSDIIVTKHMIYISLNLVRNVILLYESFSRSNAMIFMIYLLLCYFTLHVFVNHLSLFHLHLSTYICFLIYFAASTTSLRNSFFSSLPCFKPISVARFLFSHGQSLPEYNGLEIISIAYVLGFTG